METNEKNHSVNVWDAAVSQPYCKPMEYSPRVLCWLQVIACFKERLLSIVSNVGTEFFSNHQY